MKSIEFPAPKSEEIVKIALGTFARLGIESRFGDDIAGGVRVALEYYRRRLQSGRQPVRVPSFVRRRESEDPETEMDLPIRPEAMEMLEEEAKRQGVSPEEVLVHAIFVYLADADAAFPTREPSPHHE